MSEINYHIDETNRQVIAEKEGVAVGVMPWTLEGKVVHLGFTCVAAHERRQGIGSGLATVGRQRFPKEEGWEIRTSEFLAPLMADHLWREGKDERRESWFDYTGEQKTNDYSTAEVTLALEKAQHDLDNLS